jgi:ribosome-binding factor A
MASIQWHNLRVREQLHREIAWTIENRLRDPRIPLLVTVTEVRLSSDLRNATVFVSVYGSEEEKKEALIALNHAAGFIQGSVASRMSIKNFPRMHFKLDTSLDHSERINELLEKIKDDLV